MTAVKICGITSDIAFEAVAAAGAEYIGFNFFKKSPRYLTPEHAAALSGRHAGGPLRVGLFVEPDPAAIAELLRIMRLDILQIYGSAELCRQIRAETGLKIWRAVGVAAAADLPEGGEGLDGFIIEAKAPKDASRPGGNAMTMDWGLLAGWHAPLPWLLAGGLNPSNVAQAILQSGAPGVDVSSGVEAAPGEKSPALILDFVAAVRAGSSLAGAKS